MHKMRNTSAGSPTLDDLVVRVPWFSKSQWASVCRESQDPVLTDKAYSTWRKEAKANLASIHRAGIETRKVEVDADTFIGWCREKNRPVTSASLAGYIEACPDD